VVDYGSVILELIGHVHIFFFISFLKLLDKAILETQIKHNGKFPKIAIQSRSVVLKRVFLW
jgi:hypothetical protein